MARSLSLITVIVLSMEWPSTVVPLNGHEVQSNRGRNLMTGGLISLSNKVAKPAIVVIAAAPSLPQPAGEGAAVNELL
jgi:hypothetical protein